MQSHPDWNRDCLPRLPPDHADLDLSVAGEAVLQSIHARHLKVEHNDIKFFLIEFRNSLPSVGCLIAHSPIVLCLQKISQCATHNGIIIHDEDAGSL
jgi:hypothetical protein